MHDRIIIAKARFENNEFDHALMHDEPEMLTYYIPKHDARTARDYVDNHHHEYQRDGIEISLKEIRGGVIVILAVEALNELNIPMGRNAMMYKQKLDRILSKPLAEEQMHSATAGMFRANQSTRRRQSYNTNTTHGGVEHPASPKARKEEPADIKERRKSLKEQITEALDGMATANDIQPDQLFQNLISSMDKLGGRLGVGSISDKLSAKGIQFKKSKDNTAVIFYVINAATKAPQPIARVTAEQLAKPHDFENTLLSLLDMSRGDAPGALKQQQELLRSQEQAVRDVAKSVMPEPEPEKIA
jgi:hypothetical protein